MSDSPTLFADVRKRAEQVQVATADEGTAHFAVVIDGNYVRPATDLEVLLSGALLALDDWVSRMPDAGFNSDDPRWGWWHERPR